MCRACPQHSRGVLYNALYKSTIIIIIIITITITITIPGSNTLLLSSREPVQKKVLAFAPQLVQ